MGISWVFIIYDKLSVMMDFLKLKGSDLLANQQC